MGRPRPRRRARPPHDALDPRAGGAGRRRAGALPRAGAHAAGRVPVGPRADPRQPHPPPARGDLRGARGHRRARRRRPATASTTSRRSWATCSSRSCSTPSSPPRRASSRWPTWPAASTTSSCTATRTCSAPCEVDGATTRSLGATGRSSSGREGPGVADGGHPGGPAGAGLRRQGAEEGGLGRLRLGRRRTARCRRSPRSWPSWSPCSARRTSAATSSATCCSPSSTWPGTSTSTPRRRCARRPASSGPASRRVELLAADRGLDAARARPRRPRRPVGRGQGQCGAEPVGARSLRAMDIDRGPPVRRRSTTAASWPRCGRTAARSCRPSPAVVDDDGPGRHLQPGDRVQGEATSRATAVGERTAGSPTGFFGPWVQVEGPVEIVVAARGDGAARRLLPPRRRRAPRLGRLPRRHGRATSRVMIRLTIERAGPNVSG